MFWKEFSKLLCGLVLCSVVQAQEITTLDADGKKVSFNTPGRVTVILGSNEETQMQTRQSGRALDCYQGRPDFRVIVLVDLRKSLGNIVKPYVRMRMRNDLNAEALRVKPFYIQNGNNQDPRPDLSAIPDFDGTLCQQLKWSEPTHVMRVVVFGKDGKEWERWDDLKEYKLLKDSVTKALGK